MLMLCSTPTRPSPVEGEDYLDIKVLDIHVSDIKVLDIQALDIKV